MKRILLPLHSLLCVSFVVLSTICISGSASADLVEVDNASFETDPLSDDSFSFSIAGWVTSGDGGIFNPGTSAYFGGLAPDGDNVAFSSAGGPDISQVLTATLQADTRYELQIEVGNRLDETFPGYEIELRAGGEILAADLNTMTVTDGQFATSVVSYLSSATDSRLGQQLEIRFRSLGRQANFDNVRLDATAVPEPSLGVMALLSISGLIATRRRKRSDR